MLDTLKELVGNIHAEILEPVIVKGYPREEDFKSLDKLADEILKKHKSQNV